MVITGCPGYSLAIPRVILGEPVELPLQENPREKPDLNMIVIIPPKVEQYNPRGVLSSPAEAVGTRLNLLT